MILPEIGSQIQFLNVPSESHEGFNLMGKVLAVSSSKITLLCNDEKKQISTAEEWFTFYDAEGNLVCGELASNKEIEKARAEES
jgi:hypothetical protein